MIPMSIARVSHESSSRSNALLEPATGNPSYRPAIATGTLTLVIPPRTSVTVTTTSSGLTLKTAGSILDDAAPSEDTRGIGAVMVCSSTAETVQPAHCHLQTPALVRTPDAWGSPRRSGECRGQHGGAPYLLTTV